jgi:hypothetical protein
VRRVLRLVLKKMVPPPNDVTATGRSTAHTKCRNEVEDLERSVKLCGRAVADNQSERGNWLIVTSRNAPTDSTFAYNMEGTAGLPLCPL